LQKIRMPTGGTITYGSGVAADGSTKVTTRTVDANDGSGPHSWTYHGCSANTSSTTFVDVSDPAGNDTVHNFTALAGTKTRYQTPTQNYQGSRSHGTLLKTVQTDYEYTSNPFDPRAIATGRVDMAQTVAYVLPIRVTTTLPNGLVSKVESDYDHALAYHGPLDGIQYNFQTCVRDPSAGLICSYTATQTMPVTNYTGSYGEVMARREYDWGQGAPGPLLRETQTTYQWQTHSAYLTATLLNLPAVVKVLDGAGHLCAETDYFYDETLPVTPSPAINTQHSVPTTSIRGNLTTTVRKLSATPCAANATWTNVISHSTWFDTGELQSSTDPMGHTTTHLYDAAYAGAFSTQSCSPQTGIFT